jgi:hypothetical protein
MSLEQASVNAADDYVRTIAHSGSGPFVGGADPEVQEATIQAARRD